MWDLRTARKQKGLTQQQAAAALGVTQAYLSMLENNQRPVPTKKLLLVIEVYGLPYSALPFLGHEHWNRLDSEEVANELAALGYAGFSYLRPGQPKWNPAELLVAALTNDQLESRVAEGLPWLAYAFSGLNWDWVTREAKVNDVTNRLGFVVTLARELADRKGDWSAADVLRNVETRLQRSILIREETFCNESMTNAERRWLQTRKTPEAQQWNVLSDLSSENLLAHA